MQATRAGWIRGFAWTLISWSMVLASGAARSPVVPLEARPLPLADVRLTGGPLKNAQDLNARYLLALDPARLLAGYRLRAGLAPGAKGYGGWDAVEGKQLTGHLAGHYLSGVSLMYAATGDSRFKERADQVVRGLAEVQARRGNGYLGALTDQHGTDAEAIFRRISAGEIQSAGFDLNGMWSPWYVLHKTFAGLRDAWRHTANPQALEVEVAFARWAESVLAPLTEAQGQRMLRTEFGGMNEVLVDLYADTGDPRWLALADRFEHRDFLRPLQQHEDFLAGQHGNTQVPKVLGFLERYVWAGRGADLMAAGYFWDRVVRHHSYATGGHGKDEYFGEPDRLNDRVDGRTAETCNVYNMLKLTRGLFAVSPDARYADFQERALFNHILGSLEPREGWACYMVPVGRGVEREYERNMLDGGFTCCTGSSMESHALHADGIFYQSPRKLWVNLYTPVSARWAAEHADVVMTSSFPEGESAILRLRLENDEPREWTLALRRPGWAGAEFAVQVNGVPVTLDTNQWTGAGRTGQGGSYVEIARAWRSGDEVSVRLPKRLSLEPLSDNPRRAAILWGPLVLAGDLGPEAAGGSPRSVGDSGTFGSAPYLVAAERPVEQWIQPVTERPGSFHTVGVGRDRDVDLVPFYRLHQRVYAVYWDLLTPAEWERKSAEIAAERERQRQVELATVGFVQPGEMQAERDAGMRGEDTTPDRLQGRPGRRGTKWFSFEIAADPDRSQKLVVTYNRDEWQERTFRVLVDGTVVGDQKLERRGPVEFFEAEYSVPTEVVAGKRRVTVRFEAREGREIGCVYGIRMVRRGEKAKAP